MIRIKISQSYNINVTLSIIKFHLCFKFTMDNNLESYFKFFSKLFVKKLLKFIVLYVFLILLSYAIWYIIIYATTLASLRFINSTFLRVKSTYLSNSAISKNMCCREPLFFHPRHVSSYICSFDMIFVY